MTCQWRQDGHYSREHRPDCIDRMCAGCQPCTHDDNGNPVRHCRVRRRCHSHLRDGEHCCPTCLAMIRTNLHDIVDKLAVMSDEAVEAGVHSEAANLAGPHADPVLLRRRLAWHASIGIEVEEPDPNDPVTVLADRERWIREDLGHDELVLCSPTIAQSVAYLEWVLTDLARDEAQVVILSDLLAETGRLRSHLDAVRHDRAIGEEGAPCPACPDPKPRLRRTWNHHDVTGASDGWRCPADASHWWGEADYRLRIGEDALRLAPRLNLTDMATRTGVPGRTLRDWSAKGRLRAVGSEGGRKVYRVTDVEALRGEAG